MEHVVGSEGGSNDNGIGDGRGCAIIAATIGFGLFTFQSSCIDFSFLCSIDLRGSDKDEIHSCVVFLRSSSISHCSSHDVPPGACTSEYQ
jgi:hypothetical protein